MKFSIRDLFLVTVIVAVLTAWWLDHTRQSSSAKQAEHDWQAYERDLLRRLGAESSLRNSSAPAPIPPK